MLQVLTPEDMVNPHVDELSMMTYVSQFPDAKLKPGAPIRQKGDPSKVMVSGPGVESEGVTMGTPVLFYVDTQEAGHGNLEAHIDGSEDEIEVRIENKKDGTYMCSYVPPCDGPIKVDVLWNHKHVKNSPFDVNVAPATNALACRAYGQGVEGGDLKEDNRAGFTVETTGAGPGELGIVVRGPKGPVTCDVTQEDDERYSVDYTPPTPGPYTIEVTYSDLHIKDSPFKVRVDPDRPDASKCRAEGPGIEEESLVIGEETWFRVDTEGAGKGELVTNIRGPHGEVPLQVERDDKLFTYTYTPNESGELVVTVKYGGEHIPGSRFRVQVEHPPDASKCVAAGPGLFPRGVRVGEPAHFKVKSKDAGKGEVTVTITNPLGEVPFNSSSSSNYEQDFVYVPSEASMYQVDILFAGEPIPGSPFPVAVTDCSKVSIEGPGINGELLPAGVPLKYTVDTRGAGPGELACHVQTPGKKEETDDHHGNPDIVETNEEGIFQILYTPTDTGLQKIKVSFDESPIPKTPIRLNVFDSSKVVAQGPGLEDGNKTRKLTHFTIDLKQAGDGNLHVHVSGPSEVPIVLKDQANDLIHAEYMTEIPGDYEIAIQLQDENIPGSPFQVNVKPKTDPTKVKAYGPGIESEDLVTDMAAEFEVDYSNGGEGEVEISIRGPAGGVEYSTEEVGEGVSKYTYHTDPDESGCYNIDVRFAGEEIPGSPFEVPVKWKTDPGRVVAEGAGLQGGTTKEWAEFNLDLRKAGDGGINVSIGGPGEVDVKYDDHKDKTMTVRYYPTIPGEYNVDITFDGENIPGSVFKPVFDPCTDATKCFAFGPGLRKDGVKVGDLGDFVINTSAAGKGAVDVIVNGPIGGNNATRRGSGQAAKPIITNDQNGTYSVAYNPRRVGVYNVSVVFGDDEIPDSPYRVNITDPAKIVIDGPGCGELEKKCYRVDEPLEWSVDCSQVGPGELKGKIVYKKNGGEEVLVDIPVSVKSDDMYQIEYVPEYPIVYQLDLSYSDNPLDNRPTVSVLDPSKVKVTGAAFDGVDINNKANFTIDTTEAGAGDLSLELIGPSPGDIENNKNEDDSVNSFSFIPTHTGEYQLNVKFGDEALPSSPFVIQVRDITKLDIRGSGVTGLDTRVNSLADVIVDTSRSGPADITATVVDPSGNSNTIELSLSPDDEKIFTGAYIPSEPGEYQVMVEFDHQQTPDSPFTVPIGQPENVVLEGDGLRQTFVGQDNVIDCYTEGAGPGVITAEFTSPSGIQPVIFDIILADDHHSQIHYDVESPGLYSVNVMFNGFPVEDEPRTVPAVDLTKCEVSGPGISPGVLANKPTHFTVDTQEAGKGNIEVLIQDPDKTDVATETVKLEEGIHQVKYTPTSAGGHIINILYEGKDIEQSPIFLSIADPKKVVCDGKGLKSAIVNETAEFTIDVSEAGESSLNIQVTGPEEVAKLECFENDDGNRYDAVYVAQRAGLYQVHVTFANEDVPGSPFQVECHRHAPDATKCKTIDLEKPYGFTVDCREGGGTGMLEVGVCGSYVPADLISVHHNGDYTFNVSYQISEPGETTISVKWHGQHLTGSPFTVNID